MSTRPRRPVEPILTCTGQKRTTGGEDRRLEYLPLAELKEAKRNPKGHDLGLLHTSVGRFGYVEPMILDERTGRLVAGHGRLATLRQLAEKGGEPPGGVKRDNAGRWLAPVARGWASKDDTEAEAYLVASNATVEAGGWDEAQLTEMLAEIAKTGPGALAGTGYDGDDVDRMLKEVEEAGVGSGLDDKKMGGDVWQVLVECRDEMQQEEIVSRLEREGLKCRPLIF